MLVEDKVKARLSVFQELSGRRDQRLLQLSLICLVGTTVAAVAADGFTRHTLVLSLVFMLLSGWFAWKKQSLLSATLLLFDITAMLTVLVWREGGIHDVAMLGYPMVLVLAAVLGNAYLFLGLLVFIMLSCSLLVILIVQGLFTVYIHPTSYAHLVYTNIIFGVTGFCIYLLAVDLYRAMNSLKDENARVREREQTIVRLANRDQLTDLHNRRYAEFRFDDFLAEAQQQQKSVALLFLDLDNFKPVNDSLGHAAGDDLLVTLSRRLQRLVGPDDILCRFGGDEFLWLKALDNRPWPDLQRLLDQDALALVNAACKPFFILENKIDISGSVGVAIGPLHGTSFIELCRAADLAMYNAKDKGHNTFSYYNDDLNRISIDKYQMLKKIREALQGRQFELWYQPKIHLAEGRPISCEALIRWPQPDGKFITPDKFIPLAESSGLIAEIGLWVLEQACSDCMRWRAEGFAAVGVAVNVSYVQFRDGGLPSQVEAILKKTGMPAHLLELELTESLLINDADDIQQQIDRLNAMGVHLAIDDFGTGYSNLGYLRRFNARCLKIDKSFVSALGVVQRDEPLVQAMIQMAHSLGLKTVAEGVEDEACLQHLIQLGCDEGQGYWWSPAVRYDAWLGYLQRHGQRQAASLPQNPLMH